MSAAGDLAFPPSADELCFELPGSGRALFTDRAVGNLSTDRGEDCPHALRRRREICDRHGLRWLCSSEQVHGTAVHVIERIAGAGGTPAPTSADGHATTLRDVGAMILTADCLPVALGHKSAVAMLHAGWRGLAAGVIEEGVRVMRELAGGSEYGAEMVAIVGPGAGACCYEVGPEVHAALAHSHRPDPPPMRGRCDLRAIAHARLLAAGVRDIRDVDVCTICDERFFSHRREGDRAGRQVGVAWLS